MIGQIRQLYTLLKAERFFRILGITCAIILCGALAIFVERKIKEGKGLESIKDKYGALLLAIGREEEGMKLEDILSDDATSIDDFIKRKFEESGKDFFGAKKDISVIINPPDSHELTKNDWLIVISKERPS